MRPKMPMMLASRYSLPATLACFLVVFMSSVRPCSTSCWNGLSDSRWPQSLKQKPKTQDHFENGHRRVEPVVVNDPVEVGEDEENESADHAPCRRDHAKGSQSFWDVVRLKPQVGANGGGQSKKRQANVVVIEIRGDVQSGQGLQPIWLEDLQVSGAAQESQRAEEIKRT